MNESVLDVLTGIKIYTAYTTQFWESLQTNPLYNDLIEFRDVFSEAFRCELPMDKGTRHEIELKPGPKYCVMNQWPLPREQVLAIDYFVIDLSKAQNQRSLSSQLAARSR